MEKGGETEDSVGIILWGDRAPPQSGKQKTLNIRGSYTQKRSASYRLLKSSRNGDPGIISKPTTQETRVGLDAEAIVGNPSLWAALGALHHELPCRCDSGRAPCQIL